MALSLKKAPTSGAPLVRGFVMAEPGRRPFVSMSQHIGAGKGRVLGGTAVGLILNEVDFHAGDVQDVRVSDGLPGVAEIDLEGRRESHWGVACLLDLPGG